MMKDEKLKISLRKIYEQKRKNQKLYGMGVIGERGQMVIPAEARKDLGLKPGDQLVVIGDRKMKMLTAMHAETLGSLMDKMKKLLQGTGMEDLVNKDVQELTKAFKKIKK